MDWMFGFDVFLTKLDLSNFNMDKCATFDSMFSFCDYLTVVVKNETKGENYQLMIKEMPEKVKIIYE